MGSAGLCILFTSLFRTLRMLVMVFFLSLVCGSGLVVWYSLIIKNNLPIIHLIKIICLFIKKNLIIHKNFDILQAQIEYYLLLHEMWEV